MTLLRRTGETAWRDRQGFTWERNYLLLGRYVALRRHGRVAKRAHERLVEETR